MELKSCPFCGNPEDSKPEVINVWQAFDLALSHEDALDFMVMCEWCGACGEQCSTPKEAIKSWNTRQNL
jgi:ferredoxin